jgi:hypothetical protein
MDGSGYIMKIVIVGKANGWENAPYEGNVWGIHSHCLLRPFTMIWDMHKIDGTDLERGCNSEIQSKIIEYVNENKIPYMTLKKHEKIPTSVAFPLEEMPLRYSESSIAYMIWYAYHLGATLIELYGVNMSNFDEYHEQLKSTDYWIGYARGKGVSVIVNEPTAVCKGYRGLYGYDFADAPSPMGKIYQGVINTVEDYVVFDEQM